MENYVSTYAEGPEKNGLSMQGIAKEHAKIAKAGAPQW